MDLPDESQWDETTCNVAVCQHPQCWATIRRIERGHPRILGSPCKAPLDANDEFPVLTIVNISDSCFPAKRCAHHHLSGFTFAKSHSLWSQGSKLDSKFQGRPWMDLTDKDLINHTNGPPNVSHRLKKLPVLNLNEAQLPCPQDTRNKVVIWIPGEPEKHVSPAEKKDVVPSQGGKKKIKTSTKDKPPQVLSKKHNTETQLKPSGTIVPPSSPVHLFEQLSSEFIPFWNHFDTLPQELLKDLLSDAGKSMPCPEMKTQLTMMKKKPPLEKSRPDSAISAKMFLSVHRLTLQRPALRYPEYLKKPCFSGVASSLGHSKQQQQQQQSRVKTPSKKQEAKKKSKSDPGSQSTSLKHLGAMVYDPHYGPTLEEAEWFEGDEQAQVTEERPLKAIWLMRQRGAEASHRSPRRVLRAPQFLCHSLVSAASGHRTLPVCESNKKQQQPMERKGPTLKQDSTERPQMDYAKNSLDSFPSEQNPKLSKRESTNEDISTQMEVVREGQERTPKDLSASTSRTNWNPELKLLRILQATDYTDEDNQPCGTQSRISGGIGRGRHWGSLVPQQDA